MNYFTKNINILSQFSCANILILMIVCKKILESLLVTAKSCIWPLKGVILPSFENISALIGDRLAKLEIDALVWQHT